MGKREGRGGQRYARKFISGKIKGKERHLGK
jgi:hypothetical protein